jgi:flagellar export protein FliJ
MDYRFKLEALRQYRSFQEESRQKEMAEAQRIRDQEAALLEELSAMRKRTEEALAKEHRGSTTGPCLSIYNSYLNKLTADIFSQKFKLVDAEKKLVERREALLLAMQKRKTLERLKEKGREAYLENLNSEEEKFINEMAINRYNANHR